MITSAFRVATPFGAASEGGDEDERSTRAASAARVGIDAIVG
jgi:hypothetical protein